MYIKIDLLRGGLLEDAQKFKKNFIKRQVYKKGDECTNNVL